MTKRYQDRSMEAGADRAVAAEEREFFFPKANPPVTIKAASLKEAEEKLAAKTKEND